MAGKERFATRLNVPPLKSQGIKTRLIPWITRIVPQKFEGTWIEPFMGTGAVAFNLAPKHALLCDANPHLINFYQAIADGDITPGIVRAYLNREGAKLMEQGATYYYELRERFNHDHRPLDFLFVNRSGFNGMIRFNKSGGLNIPFCRKPRRFVQAYVTKIVNQVSYVGRLLAVKDFVFKCQSFEKTIASGRAGDMIYCDPPYIDRHVDYYNGWDGEQEKALHDALSNVPSRFILSTWHHNDYRSNHYIDSMWSEFNVLTREHFYHVGGRETNRHPVVEAVVTNYKATIDEPQETHRHAQLALLDP